MLAFDCMLQSAAAALITVSASLCDMSALAGLM